MRFSARTTPEETAAMAVTFLDHFPAQEYPHLAELTTEHVLQPGYDYGREFEFGLTLILDGLERAHTPMKKTARKPASSQPARPLASDLVIRAEPPNQTPRSS